MPAPISIPVELTTYQGYEEFVKSPLCNDYSTVFSDNDANTGYVLVNDEVVATVSGEARDYLFGIQTPKELSPLNSVTNVFPGVKSQV